MITLDAIAKQRNVRTGIIGGGRGCYELLKLFISYRPRHLSITIVGVADPCRDAVGRVYAEQQNIKTFDNLEELLRTPDLDLVIELTGNDSVLAQIIETKSKSCKVLDHLGAQFLWEIIEIQEDKIHLEKKIATLDTMTAVGEMAYRLVDRLRNPLMVAGGTVRRSMTRVDVPHNLRKKLKKVAGSIQKMEEVIADICDVVRPLSLDLQLTDLNTFFKDFCKAVKIEARFVNADFNCLLEEELPAIALDPSLFRQALWHVLENCFDAAAPSDSFIQLRVLVCYDYILVQITDDSEGLAGVSAQAALDPFVSTRLGRMGLGLTLCRQIIHEHGGEMELWNNQQGGVTVSISIPITFMLPEKKSARLEQGNLPK